MITLRAVVSTVSPAYLTLTRCNWRPAENERGDGYIFMEKRYAQRATAMNAIWLLQQRGITAWERTL